MMLKRAWAKLEVKAAEESGGKRVLRGIATTPATDSYGDIVESEGAQFDLPLPVLWQHDAGDPVGWVTMAKPNSKGIPVEIEIASVAEPGALKDRLDMVWQYAKTKLVRGLSIGFNPIEFNQIKGSYGYHFLKWAWLELSLVTIPANQEASITAIKSADSGRRAPLGTRSPATHQRHAPSGTQGPKGTTMKKTLQELLELKQVKLDRSKELIDLREKGGDDFGADQRAELIELDTELTALEDEIVVARMEQRHQAATARPVQMRYASTGDQDGDGKSKAQQRRGLSFSRNADPDEKFKGENFVRIQIAKALSYKQNRSAVAIAEERWGQTHKQLVNVIRATVAGMGSGSGEAGAELLNLDAMYTGDFIEYLYSRTVYDQLPFRMVPANVRVKGQDGQYTGYWVGQSKAIPTSKGDYSSVDLTPLKVAGLAVISMELLEDSSPAAEGLVRDGLVQASSQRVDQTLFSADAAVAGVSPAGLLNGVSALSPSGTDLAATRADFQALLSPFVTAKMATGLYIVMNPGTGLALSMMYGSLDQPAYPDVNENGGTINRRPVVVGDNVTSGDVIAIRPQDVWKIGDSGVRVEMSTEATIEQRDDPTGATDTPTGVTTTGLTNMFQEESVAFKVVRRINFQKRRSNAVQYLSNVEWGGVVS